MARFLLAFLAAALFSCKQATPAPEKPAPPLTVGYDELHRPQIHFTPATHWMNDPNGLVFYEGEWHLFYQFYPDSSVWGPMHWAFLLLKLVDTRILKCQI